MKHTTFLACAGALLIVSGQCATAMANPAQDWIDRMSRGSAPDYSRVEAPAPYLHSGPAMPSAAQAYRFEGYSDSSAAQ